MENWEIEKSKYIDTLETIITGISNILNMESCSIIDSVLKGKLITWKMDSEKLLHKLRNDEFEIAIVGLEKAGKSSFSNALIENNLLPTDELRCTYTSTCITYNEEDNATVVFYTREEFARDFSDKLAKMGIEHPENYSFEVLTKEQYDQIFQKIDPEKQKLYSTSLNLDVLEAINHKESILNYLIKKEPIEFHGEALNSKEFRDFITDPAKAIAVKEITIGSKLLVKMREAVIYDVPGFNSPTEMHQQQTRAKMKSADAIVLIAKADEPSLTGEVLDVFRECDNDGTVLKEKLFVFANKADRTKNIQKNIETTYEEWIGKRNILEEKHKDRIFFGSSNAHLQAIDKLPEDEKDDYISALKKRGLEDGINDIRTALEEYNRTARFEVLKGRINKTKGAIAAAFEEINQKYPVSGIGNFARGKMIYLVLNFTKEFINKAEKSLQSYRDDVVRGKMQMDKPLSKDIAEYILNTITVDNYQITDEELEKAHKSNISSVTEHEAPQTIEPFLRSEKFKRMYRDFSDAIMSISVENHAKCRNDIVDRLMEAMGLSNVSLYYDDIRNKIWKNFSDKISRSNDEGYYQSLIERFSRDIYEILIQCTYSEERYNKFYPEMDNFFSLSVFYNPNPTKENKLDYINKAPKDQQLCNLLLFHNGYVFENMEDCISKRAELADRVKELTGLTELSEKNMNFIKTIVQADYVNADKIIGNALADCKDRNENQMTISVKIDMLLERAVKEMKEKGDGIFRADISKPEEFKKAYANYFANLRSNHTYEKMRKDFACDIEILQDVLLHAFIKAINMEKSFIAREVKSIENVISWIKSEEFDTFISENIGFIKAEEFDNIDRTEAEIKMKVAFIAEINKIITTINQA